MDNAHDKKVPLDGNCTSNATGRLALKLRLEMQFMGASSYNKDLEGRGHMGRNSLSWKLGYVWSTIFVTLFQFSQNDFAT